MTQISGVSTMMKNLALVILVAACSGKQTPISNSSSGSDTATGPRDTRTEIERRRDTACETLGPRVTTCAVEDARAQLAAGKITQAQFNETTATGVQKKNTEEFIKTCSSQPYSSRQVRVLEVCQGAETECEPLLSCLDNLNPKE